MSGGMVDWDRFWRRATGTPSAVALDALIGDGAARTVVEEAVFERVALSMVEDHGDDASYEALMRAVRAFTDGDRRSGQFWGAICIRIVEAAVDADCR